MRRVHAILLGVLLGCAGCGPSATVVPTAPPTLIPVLTMTVAPTALLPTATAQGVRAVGPRATGAAQPITTGATVTPAPGPRSAEIIGLSPPVSLCHQGACGTPGTVGAQLGAGDTIQTGPKGLVTLESATTVFRLEAQAELSFAEVTNAVTRLVLRSGRLLVKHDPAGHDLITVQAHKTRVDAIDTRFTVAFVERGLDHTDLAVAVPSGGGQVAVAAEGHIPAQVAGGQQVTFACAICPEALPPGIPTVLGGIGQHIATPGPPPPPTPLPTPAPIRVEPIAAQEQAAWDAFDAQLPPTPR